MMLTYDPKEVAVIIGGKIMSGFADGEFVKIERNEAAWNLKVGVDGEGTRAKSNNQSGKVTITLMQSSPSNDDLSAFAAADELSSTGAVPILVKDSSGTTICTALTAWIMKYPDAPFAKEPVTRAWVLESDQLLIFLGGNEQG